MIHVIMLAKSQILGLYETQYSTIREREQEQQILGPPWKIRGPSK